MDLYLVRLVFPDETFYYKTGKSATSRWVRCVSPACILSKSAATKAAQIYPVDLQNIPSDRLSTQKAIQNKNVRIELVRYSLDLTGGERTTVPLLGQVL